MNGERQTIGATASPVGVPSGVLQRKCACGQHTVAGGSCSECAEKKELLQRKATCNDDVQEAPSIVHDVLRSPGQPLDPGTQSFFGAQLGHDFSGVRIHTDSRAAESARSVNELVTQLDSRSVDRETTK